MTEFIIKMSTEAISGIDLVNFKSIFPIKNKNSNEIIKTLEKYFFKFLLKDSKARKLDPDETDILKEIFRHFMVYEEPKKVIINTCSIKPVALYLNTLKRLLADLESDNPNWDSSHPLFKNTANVVMNGVLEMDYVSTILDSASKEARLAFATWTNPMYLISN